MRNSFLGGWVITWNGLEPKTKSLSQLLIHRAQFQDIMLSEINQIFMATCDVIKGNFSYERYFLDQKYGCWINHSFHSRYVFSPKANPFLTLILNSQGSSSIKLTWSKEFLNLVNNNFSLATLHFFVYSHGTLKKDNENSPLPYNYSESWLMESLVNAISRSMRSHFKRPIYYSTK